MRLITRADDELYGLASVAAKLGRSDRLTDRLRAARLADPGNAEAAFSHALVQMAMLPSIEVEFDAHVRFGETIEAFGQVLALDPQHWLARYSRARLRALNPSSYGVMTGQVSTELVEAARDVADLLILQAEVGWQPYFASSRALAAVIGYLSGDTEDSTIHLAALAQCPPARVELPVLGALLCEPFMTLHAIKVDEDRDWLGRLMAALYGDQPVVARALTPQPSG